MTAWYLVGTIVFATTAGDILQSFEMKRHGEISDFRPSGIWHTLKSLLGRPLLILSVLCMAASFFAFMSLLRVADLSFAVPATAASFVLETILARVVLKENVGKRRWVGALCVACGVALLAA